MAEKPKEKKETSKKRWWSAIIVIMIIIVITAIFRNSNAVATKPTQLESTATSGIQQQPSGPVRLVLNTTSWQGAFVPPGQKYFSYMETDDVWWDSRPDGKDDLIVSHPPNTWRTNYNVNRTDFHMMEWRINPEKNPGRTGKLVYVLSPK